MTTSLEETSAPPELPHQCPLRILLIAENASLRFGGEAALPLHYFRFLRRRGIEVWLLVNARNRAELSAMLPHEADRIFYLPDGWFPRLALRLAACLPQQTANFTMGQAIYMAGQHTARRLARRLIPQLRIDLVHQPIPVSPRQVSLVHGLGVPVVMGPLNGGMSFPPAFRRRDRLLDRLFMTFGRACATLVNRLLPGKLRAATLLVANERTRHILPRAYCGRIVTLPENGVDLQTWHPPRLPPASTPARSSVRPVRFVFIGRLVPLKGVDLLLRALARAAARHPMRLDIIGDGAIRADLARQAAQLGLADRVSFLGFLSQPQCATELAAADVFVLPSLHECGGAVVLEAMAMGLPVIATDWGGPPDYVDPSCGILVAPAGTEPFIADLAAAMVTLAASPDLRRRLGAAGYAKVLREFDWERKIDRILEVYAEAVARTGRDAVKR